MESEEASPALHIASTSAPQVPAVITQYCLNTGLNIYASALDDFDAALKKLKPLRYPCDFFIFSLKVRSLLENSAELSWVLQENNDKLSPPEVLVAHQCASHVLRCLSLPLLTFSNWALYPRDLLEQLEALTPPYTEIMMLSGEIENMFFPSRSRKESMQRYVKRVVYWARRYFPTLYDNPGFARTTADFMWIVHMQFCDALGVYHHYKRFLEARKKFNRLEDAINWFKLHPVFQKPLLFRSTGNFGYGAACYDKELTTSNVFPLRRPEEYIHDYTERVELWAHSYHPAVLNIPDFARSVADRMWIDHARSHDLQILFYSYMNTRNEFSTLQEALDWFKNESDLISPPIKHQRKSAHRNKLIVH